MSSCTLQVFELKDFSGVVREILTKIDKSALSHLVLKQASEKRFAEVEPPHAGETQHSPPHFN